MKTVQVDESCPAVSNKKSIYQSWLADVMRPVLPSADWTSPIGDVSETLGGAAIITRYHPEHQRGQ